MLALTLNPITVSYVVGVFLPILVGLATTQQLHPKWKALILVVLSAIAAAINISINDSGEAVLSQATLDTFIQTLVAGVAAYFGVWKPFNFTSSTPSGKLGPNVGIK